MRTLEKVYECEYIGVKTIHPEYGFWQRVLHCKHPIMLDVNDTVITTTDVCRVCRLWCEKSQD